jgi:hypothetical protein
MEPDCVGEGDAVGPLWADALPLFIPPEATHTLPVVNAIDPEAPEAPAKKKPRKGAEDFTIEQFEKATAFWEEYAAKNKGKMPEHLVTGKHVNMYGINDMTDPADIASAEKSIKSNFKKQMQRMKKKLDELLKESVEAEEQLATEELIAGRRVVDGATAAAENKAMMKEKGNRHHAKHLKIEHQKEEDTCTHEFTIKPPDTCQQTWEEVVAELSKVQAKVSKANSYKWHFGADRGEDENHLKFRAEGYEDYGATKEDTKTYQTRRHLQKTHTCVLSGIHQFMLLANLYPLLGQVISKCMHEANVWHTNAKLVRAHLLFQKERVSQFLIHKDNNDHPVAKEHKITMVVYLGGGRSSLKVLGYQPAEFKEPGDVKAFLSKMWHETHEVPEGSEPVKMTFFFDAFKEEEKQD